MPKRKQCDGDDNSIPLPIQLFLWRQTNPFIKGKQTIQCDASCVSFERVVVQNILHGLSPSLCEALQNVSRWKVIGAAFPHVLHCCSTLLQQRQSEGRSTKFSSNETKLLYTLHWIVLDAASECEDLANEKFGGNGSNGSSYMFSLENIQLFVYLMGPLIESLKEESFETLKLENGLRMWRPLWEYRQPEVPCFATPVKPRRNIIKAQRNVVRFNTANIYIGKGTSVDDIYLGFDPPETREDDTTEGDEGDDRSSTSNLAPIARMSDICALSTTTSCTESTSIEILCEICNQLMQNRNGDLSCKCGTRPMSTLAGMAANASVSAREGDGTASTAAAAPPDLLKPDSPIDKSFIAKSIKSTITGGVQGAPSQDVLSASYFDVAVLRCLFSPQWAEEGVYWALRYIHQRLLEVCDDMQAVEVTRERSQSLPTPEILITLDSEEQTPSTPLSPRKETELILPAVTETRKEPAFKRMKVTELKHMIEGKVKQFRRRESQDHIEVEHGTGSAKSSPDFSNVANRKAGLGKLNEEGEDTSTEDEQESGDSLSDHGRRKSLPAIKRFTTRKKETGDDDVEIVGGTRKNFFGRDQYQRGMSLKPEMLQRPIITITEDSSQNLSLSPKWCRSKRASMISQVSNVSDKSQASTQANKGSGITRSMTDSKIAYNIGEESEEVTGSTHFIQKDGQLNYKVVLQAVHTIAAKDCSARVCGVLLNTLNCLLDLGLVEKHEPKKKKEVVNFPVDGENDKENNNVKKEKTKKEDENKTEVKGQPTEQSEKTTHHLAMETVLRIFRTIGCPHGCGDGFRQSQGDHLRTQGLLCLTRLQHIHPPQFRKFLRQSLMSQPLQDIIDFLHALLGFCMDPTAHLASPQTKKDGGMTGYANNFGEADIKHQQVSGQIVIILFKSLLTRMVESQKDLQGHENISLYCDVRQFMNYVKESHGGTFRLIALSGLSDALDKSKKKKVPTATLR